MASVRNHEYLFALSEKTIRAVLYDVGTARDRRISPYNAASVGDISDAEPVLTFLEQAGLMATECYNLSPEGKQLFEALFLYPDDRVANEMIATILLRDPAINILCQSFYGRGKIGIEQLRTLFNYHRISSREVVYTDVVALLTLLNKFQIVVYDKKNKVFTVKKAADIYEPIPQYYITPNTPFSNVYNMRKVIRACKGNIFWIDKHFRKEGLEMLLDGLPYEGITSITIISGTDNVTASAKTDFYALQTELANRAIDLQWRIVTDSGFKWHDRWLVADNQCHNIPPVLAIIRGQRSEILKASEPLDVNPFVAASTPIE